jgi:hypothetical protein
VQLLRAVPKRFQLEEWSLKFNLSTDGTSLNTFYARAGQADASIVAIQDSNGKVGRGSLAGRAPQAGLTHEAPWQVFGSYTSHAWHDAPSYYGSGECFVFELRDGQLKMYTWSGKNSLFMLSNAESFAIGGG